jgi:hypothetical protein
MGGEYGWHVENRLTVSDEQLRQEMAESRGGFDRICQRLLALTAAIWHNETTNQPGPARSLIAYDH